MTYQFKIRFAGIILFFSTFSFPAEIIVKLKSYPAIVSKSNRENILRTFTATIPTRFSITSAKYLLPYLSNKTPLDAVTVFNISDPKLTVEVVNYLKKDPNVEYAHENHVYHVEFIPSDPRFAEQWYLQKIGAPQAWDVEKGSPSVLIAIIDTGIDYNHPDLSSNIWRNTGEMGLDSQARPKESNGIDDDGNGYIDDWQGYDFTDAPDFPDDGDYLIPDNDPMDQNGHGTGVAGVVGAVANNGEGISGLAFGCKIMNLKAGTKKGYLAEDNIASATVYAVGNGAKVINMSFGDVVSSPLLQDVIQYAHSKNVVIVASAGNDASYEPHYPSGFPEVISVGATTKNDYRASFSNFASSLALMAPGEEILTCNLSFYTDKYVVTQGTSFSAPLVSAAAGLVLSHFPDLSNNVDAVKGLLESSADDIGEPGWDRFYAAGRLNVARALATSFAPIARITDPKTDSGTSQDSVSFYGLATGAYLDYYQLQYGVGLKPVQWTDITLKKYRQVIDEFLGSWHTSGLSDTSYTIQLIVHQKNGIDVEDHITFQLDRTKPRLSNFQMKPMYSQKVTGQLISFDGDDPVTAKIFYRPQGATANFDFISFSYSKNQKIFISQNELNGLNEFFIVARNSAGLEDTLKNGGNYYLLNLSQPPFFRNEFVEKDFRLGPAYLLNRPSDFNRNGKPEVIFSRYSANYSFGPIIWAEESAGLLVDVGSLSFPAVPRDWANLDSKRTALLVGVNSKTYVLADSIAKKRFPRTILWQDTSNFWGARLQDVDGDGNVELIGRRGNVWEIWSFDSLASQFQIVQSLPNLTPGNNEVGVPHVEIGDLDGDGKNELLFGDNDGDIYLYKVNSPGSYSWLWSQRLPQSDAIDFIAIGETDANLASKEFIAGCHSNPNLNSESDLANGYWTYRIYTKNSTPDSLFAYQEFNFFGLNPPQQFDSGVTVGDVDNDGEQEIFISVYPNLYMLKNEGGSYKVIWNIWPSRSNSIWIGDLDQNGFKDFLFNDGQQVKSFEWISNLKTPAPFGFSAYPLDTTRVQLKWDFTSGINYTKIYRGPYSTPQDSIGISITGDFIDTGLKKDTTYFYSISFINNSNTPRESRRAQTIRAIPDRPPTLIKADYLGVNQIAIQFSKAMSQSVANHQNFVVFKQTQLSEIRSVILSESGKRIILTTNQSQLDTGTYQVQASHVFDLQGIPIDTLNRKVSFIVSVTDIFPYLISATLQSGGSIGLQFNEPLKDSLANLTANYSIQPPIPILSAGFQTSDHSTLFLTLDKSIPIGALGKDYLIRVQNVENLKGKKIRAGYGDAIALLFYQQNLANVFTYPNPFRASQANGVMFANLTARAEIQIFTVSGRPIRRIVETNQNGGVEWDVRDEQGRLVPSGIYLYIVTDGTAKKIGKMAIIR